MSVLFWWKFLYINQNSENNSLLSSYLLMHLGVPEGVLHSLIELERSRVRDVSLPSHRATIIPVNQ